VDWVDEAKIPDSNAAKPDDWDDDAPATIVDVNAVKPVGWLEDEPEFIPDASATIPDDWDLEEDGDFEPPLIRNPKCTVGCGEWRPTIKNPNFRGKWRAPLIDNPAFKGVWKPQEIENPAYYEETNPAHFQPIGAIAFELWTTNKDIMFDNVMLSTNAASARDFAESTWRLHHEEEKQREQARLAAEQPSLVDQLREFTEENPLAVAAGAVGVLLVVLYFVFRSGPQRPAKDSRMAARHKKDDDAPQSQDDENERNVDVQQEHTDDQGSASNDLPLNGSVQQDSNREQVPDSEQKESVSLKKVKGKKSDGEQKSVGTVSEAEPADVTQPNNKDFETTEAPTSRKTRKERRKD